jgi:hypothetical protein
MGIGLGAKTRQGNVVISSYSPGTVMAKVEMVADANVMVFWVNECKTLEGTAGGQLNVLVNGGGLQVDCQLLEGNSDVGGIN